jgi:hypothetical protein
MTNIRWEDPSSTGRIAGTRNKWFVALTPLIEHPKRWAIVATRDDSTSSARIAYNLRYRKVNIPPGQWEFTTRLRDGEYCVYARYLGPDETGGVS